MSVSIVEKLQQDSNPEVAFTEVKRNFTNPDEFVNQLKPSLPELESNTFEINSFDLSTLDNTVAEVPVSDNELQTSISGRINQINSINLETLSAEIPISPGADNFQDIDYVNDIQKNISNLTKDLVGDLSIGEVEKSKEIPQGTEDIFGEFNRFVTNAGMLPVRTLDALLKVFKKLLDKLSDPEQLLQQLGSSALTDDFSEQIQSLQEQIPSEAIRIIAQNINQRQEEIVKYNDKLNQFKELINKFDNNKILTPAEVNNLKEDIKIIRQEVKEIANNLENLDGSTADCLGNLRKFKLSDFQTNLKNISKLSDGAIVLEPLFNKINSYIDTIFEKIATITNNLREFTQKIPQLIDDGIKKVESIATQITKTISQKIEQGKDVLSNLKDYLSEIIQKIRKFIEDTSNKSSQLVRPFKEVSNQASSTVVRNIDEISGKIKDATGKLESSIGDVNEKVTTNLNQEQLVKKIGEFLDKVTGILEGESVKNAISTTQKGIQTITSNLEQITLEPAFEIVVNKSGDLENTLKAVDVSTLSTPSKVALKVGTEVIKQVDIPGTVTPELQSAFQEVLNPLENIIVLIEGEFQKIDNKIISFKPGTLVEEFLSPYLTPVINKLDEYKPSLLLAPVKDFYNDLLGKLDKINPNQLLEKLEELYLKLVNVIESLSPEKITEFLQTQLNNIQQQLDNLPVEALVQKVKDGLGQVDKLMASLGLGDVLKSDFWQTLREILSFSFADKIKEIEKIRNQVAGKIGAIDDQKLTQQLEELKIAINTYINKPETATDTSIVTTASANYSQVTVGNPNEILTGIIPPAEVIVDYRDLKKRLGNLYANFTDTRRPELPKKAVTELKRIIKDKPKLQGDESSRKALLKTSNSVLKFKLITDFKQVVPNEIDRQVTNPIKEILGKLDEIMEQPRAILGDIEKVITKIAETPGKLAKILVNITDKLAEKIRDAINSLKQVITDLTNEVVNTLKETHQIIVDTVKSLNPRRLLHIFEEGDFYKLDKLIQLIKQPLTDDPVSQYINSQFSANTRSLLTDSKSPATKTAIIQDLNKLLLDTNFYDSARFQKIKLSAQAEELRQKNNKTETEIIFFNRLLLEAAYNSDKSPQERIIVMNIESIFPYLQAKLAEIYPQEVVDRLDELHQNIIQLLRDIPQAIGKVLDNQYQDKVVDKTESLRQEVYNLFKALRDKLEALKSELDIGLEDVADSFERLLNAIPV